ncbi:hypothetical protein NMG60_11037380 [Bertholletia excelsa]
MADSDDDLSGERNNNKNNGHSNNANSELSPREQDRFLPIANVSRIMKKALPANAKISKDAKETVQECVSEFISFVTGEASDKCQREKRKTINGDDLIWAMTTLGFEDYIDPLKVYLQRFRDMEGEKTVMAGRQGGEKDAGAGNGNVVNLSNGAAGFTEAGLYRGMHSNVTLKGGHLHHEGPIFGSGMYQHLTSVGSGNVGSGFPGLGIPPDKLSSLFILACFLSFLVLFKILNVKGPNLIGHTELF